MPRYGFIVILIACIAILTFPAAAQENLLANPGFETEGNWTGVSSGGGGIFSAPPNWGGWLAPASVSVPNGYPHRRIFVSDDASEGEIGQANANNLFIRTGNFSANIGRGGGAFTGAIYQQVSVPEGSNVQGSAWVIMNLPAGANLQARVGIDPNGGTNPNDSDVVWSSFITNQLGQFGQMTASATATGPTVTLFLYFTTQAPVDPNALYFDDASLVIGGSGGAAPGADGGEDAPPAATPVPTAPPVAAFVQPQGAQPDGSIVHTVNAGDTLDAIAVAYGVPRAELIELNNITDARLIRVGQRLLIRPAPDDAADDEDTEAADDTPAESEDEDATEEAAAETEEAEEPAEDESDEAETDEASDPTEEATATPEPTETEAPVETEEPAETEEATEEAQEADEEGEAVAAAPTAQPTATTPAPVAMADTDDAIDPSAMAASVCVGLFEDANANRVQDSDESALAGGTIRLNQGGAEVQNFQTDGTPDLYCFESLQPGEYVALADVPEGYGLTTPDQRRLRLQPGTNLNIVFGAAQGVEAVAPPPADVGDLNEVAVDEPEAEEDNVQQLLQYAGLIVFALAAVTLIGGVGVAFALRRR